MASSAAIASRLAGQTAALSVLDRQHATASSAFSSSLKTSTFTPSGLRCYSKKCGQRSRVVCALAEQNEVGNHVYFCNTECSFNADYFYESNGLGEILGVMKVEPPFTSNKRKCTVYIAVCKTGWQQRCLYSPDQKGEEAVMMFLNGGWPSRLPTQ